MKKGLGREQPAEIRLLVWLASRGLDPPMESAAPDVAGVDWRELDRAARFHRVVPLVARGLEGARAALVPRATRESLLRRREQVTRLARMQLETLRRFSEAAAGLDFLVLKGPAVGSLLYDDALLRPGFDLDLLVRPRDAVRAAGILERIGWRPSAVPPQLVLDEALFRRLKRYKNDVLFRDATGINVELQWRLARFDPELRYSAEEALREAQELEADGLRFRTLAADAQLPYLAYHGARHAWKRLHWLVDIVQLVRAAEVDFDAAAERAERAGVAASLAEALALARRVFGMEVPEPLRRWRPFAERGEGLARAVLRHRYRVPVRDDSLLDVVAFEARALRRYPSVSTGARVALSHLSPGPHDWAVVDLPSWAEPLYYPIRLARLCQVAMRAARERPTRRGATRTSG